MARTRKRFTVCGAGDLLPGERRIVALGGRSVGLFNVDGRLFALHNRCPHQGAELCRGVLTGTALPSRGFTFEYARAGQILRCPWHGWEFDIESGHGLFDPKIRARTFETAVEHGKIVVYI